MSVSALAVLVTLATIPPVHAIVAAVIQVWRAVSPRSRHADANSDTIFLASVAPVVLAACAALLVTLPAFLLFEPAGDREAPGALLAISAAMGSIYVVIAVARAIGVVSLSRRCMRAWLSDATPLPTAEWGLPAYAIDASYPVVAVAGVIRPRLLIDRRVLAACSAEELHAITGHELAHVRSHDNARRLLVAACVGSHSAQARQWRSAAELAADERAATDPDRAVVLAGALIKIARLAAVASAPPIPFAAMHDGSMFEARVQRLLTSHPPPDRSRWQPWLAAGVAGFVLVMGVYGVQLLAAVHGVIELFVRSQ